MTFICGLTVSGFCDTEMWLKEGETYSDEQLDSCFLIGSRSRYRSICVKVGERRPSATEQGS